MALSCPSNKVFDWLIDWTDVDLDVNVFEGYNVNMYLWMWYPNYVEAMVCQKLLLPK